MHLLWLKKAVSISALNFIKLLLKKFTSCFCNLCKLSTYYVITIQSLINFVYNRNRNIYTLLFIKNTRKGDKQFVLKLIYQPNPYWAWFLEMELDFAIVLLSESHLTYVKKSKVKPIEIKI